MIRITKEEAVENLNFIFKIVERGETVLIEGDKGNILMNGIPDGQLQVEALETPPIQMTGPQPPIPGVTLPSDAEVKSYVTETLGELKEQL